MTGPLAIASIVSRLAAQVPALRQTEAALDLAAAQAGQLSPPCAFVLLAQEQGGPRIGGSGVYRQMVTATVAVLYAVQAYGAATGAAAQTELDTLLPAARGALLNWKPTGADTVLELVGGQSLGVSNDLALWLDRYRCTYGVSLAS